MTNKERSIKVIRELKNGEWEYEFNDLCGIACVAKRNGLKLWVGNGGFWTDIEEYGNYFGWFWRHIVWWLGIRQTKKEFEKNHKRKMQKKNRGSVMNSEEKGLMSGAGNIEKESFEVLNGSYPTDEAREFLKTVYEPEYHKYIDTKLAGDFACRIAKSFKDTGWAK